MSKAAQLNVASLKKVLGRTFSVYVQVHGYHWNVEGPEFRQYHALFEEQYQDLWNTLDPIAERIRSLDAYAPASVAELMKLADKEAAPAKTASEMFDAMIDAHKGLMAVLREAIEAAQKAGDEPSIGLLTDRLGWHEKQLWMMRASRK